MNNQTIGWIGAIVGSGIGILGGLIGTYFSIKRAANDRQRSFMMRCAIFFWVFVLCFVSLVCFLPAPWKYFIWVVYAVGLPIAIMRCNQRTAQLDEPTNQV